MGEQEPQFEGYDSEQSQQTSVQTEQIQVQHPVSELLSVPVEVGSKITYGGDERWDIQKAETLGAVTQDISKTELGEHGIRKYFSQEISAFEEIYNLNPEKFSQMSTADFMEICQPLRNINGELTYISENAKGLTNRRKELDNSLNKSRRLLDETDNIRMYLLRILEPDNDDYDAIDKKLRNVFGDTFDKTPRQIVQEQIDIIDEYQQLVDAKLSLLSEARQKQLDTHKPADNPTEAASL